MVNFISIGLTPDIEDFDDKPWSSPIHPLKRCPTSTRPSIPPDQIAEDLIQESGDEVLPDVDTAMIWKLSKTRQLLQGYCQVK